MKVVLCRGFTGNRQDVADADAHLLFYMIDGLVWFYLTRDYVV